MEKIFSPEDCRELLKGWQIHARKSWKKHEEAARRLEAQYRTIGVASLVLSAIVGASLFASLEAVREPWSRIIAGIVSISASVLSSLITFHRYEERTERHRKAGGRYKILLVRLEQALAAPDSSLLDKATIDRIRQEIDQVEETAPVVPEHIDRAIEDDYQVYRFVSKATDLRHGKEDAQMK
jgi:hypothetical protein